ncbi:MAG: hypothetical protein ACI4GZ_04925 [Ruminococcus sp.]
MKKTNTLRIAFCAVITAASVAFMLLTSVIPIGTYALPCIAGIFLCAVVIEFGYIWAAAVYVAVSVLSFLLAADKEAALYYTAFLGFYPMLKGLFEKLSKKWLQWILKLLLFNLSMVVAFYASLFVLSVPKESFYLFGFYVPWVFLLLGNIAFLIYDLLLTRLITEYVVKWRKKLKFK